MPDIARFVRVFFPDADGAAAHLIAEHKGADKACQNQGIDAGRIPAFAEQGFRADQNLHCALGKMAVTAAVRACASPVAVTFK